MKQTIEFIKLTILTVGGTVAIMIMLGIASVPALADSKSLYKMPWGSKLPKDVASGTMWG